MTGGSWPADTSARSLALTANDVGVPAGASSPPTRPCTPPSRSTACTTSPNRNGTWPKRDDPAVLRAGRDEEEARAKIRRRSRRRRRCDHVREDAPPFFVVHGDLDTLAPVADARDFVDKLRAVSDAPGAVRGDEGRRACVRRVPLVPHGPRDRRDRTVPAARCHEQYLEGRTHGAVSEREAAEQLVGKLEHVLT